MEVCQATSIDRLEVLQNKFTLDTLKEFDIFYFVKMPCLPGIYACALTVTLTYCRVTWNVHAGYACINTFMSIACNGLKELIDYVHVDEDRVIQWIWQNAEL